MEPTPTISFASLPSQKQDFRSLALSAAVNLSAVIAVLVLGRMATQIVRPQLVSVELEMPSTPPPIPATSAHFHAAAPKNIPVLKVEPARIVVPVHQPEPPSPPVARINLPTPAPVIARIEPTVHLAPQPKLTNAFDTQKVSPASSRANITVVRFGVSQINPNATNSTHVAPAGSMFGSIQGGGPRLQAGHVGSSGFGSGTATGSVRAQGQVRDVRFSVPTISPAATPVRIAVATTPVVVTSKPIPQYTEAARKLGIQGNVILEVTFMPDGQVKIVRVVKGIGHGLDQQAEVAARNIRFKPATKDGRPLEVTTTISILFELA